MAQGQSIDIDGSDLSSYGEGGEEAAGLVGEEGDSLASKDGGVGIIPILQEGGPGEPHQEGSGQEEDEEEA